MDAPISPQELIRPWRTATLVASLIAAVELVLLLVAAAVLVAKPLSHSLEHHAAAAKTAAPVKTAPKQAPVVHVKKAPPARPHLSRGQTGVLVLNGNGENGAAGAEALKLQGLGYPVTGTGNARRQDYASSVVLYRTGFRAEGLRLAHDLGLQVTGPLDGLRSSQLDGGKLALILGA